MVGDYMKDQNIQLYRVFTEVAKYRNITHAAKSLYISQPAVSNAITNLETNLGTTLFIRKSRGVELTEEGKTLYRYINSAFDTIEKGEMELVQSKKNKISRISIGMSTTMCHFMMRPFMKKFIEEHPEIEISLVNQSSYQTFQMLEEYLLDIGITTEPVKTDIFEYHPFMSYEYIFVATPQYLQKLQSRNAKSVEDYFAYGTLMLLYKIHPLRAAIDQYFYDKGYKIGHMLEVSNMDLLIDFSIMGMGIGYVIRNFVKDELVSGALIELPIMKHNEGRTFGLTYNSNFRKTAAMETFIAFFEEMYPIVEP